MRRSRGPGGAQADQAAQEDQLTGRRGRHRDRGGPAEANVEPDAVAQLILSICLGFVAQRSLTGDVEVQAHADALAALTTARPAEAGASGSGTP